MTDNQRKVVELYLQGETITNISKIVGLSRVTIHKYMKDEEVKTTIAKGLSDAKQHVADRITASSEVYISELAKIALTSKDEKLRAQCLQYMLDHTIGKATTRIENTSSTSSENAIEDIDDMLKDLEIEDNVVELPKRKAK